MPQAIRFPRPDDFHQHLREGDAMNLPLAHASAQFGRIMAMPNLSRPIKSGLMLGEYLSEVDSRKPEGSRLEVFGTLYLGPEITPQELETTLRAHPLLAVKWYPRGVTTNSSEGVSEIEACHTLLEAMQELGVTLSIHGEVNDPLVDIFDREKTFIRSTLLPLLERFPALRMVLEHISTRAAVECLHAHGGDRLAATITAHHLLVNRHHLLAGGIKPHLYCLPIVKREEDRLALLGAATSGKPYFFLGSDSAPHARVDKESACGCAGCYTGAHAMELYAEVFDQAGALERLVDFASRFGADYYRLPEAGGEIQLERRRHRVPADYGGVTPFWAKQELNWRVAAFS